MNGPLVFYTVSIYAHSIIESIVARLANKAAIAAAERNRTDFFFFFFSLKFNRAFLSAVLGAPKELIIKESSKKTLQPLSQIKRICLHKT